jgi:glutathione S-transferase
MPSYKLYYFDGRGRAELARLIFAAAGQEYEDVRYAHQDWPQHKANFPFGQLPVLEVDGVKVAQSAAIAHFLGVQLGLAGKTAVDHFKTHAFAEAVRDFVEPMARIVWEEKDEERKKTKKEEYLNVTLKTGLERFEKHLEHASSGHLVGDSVTYADLALYYGLTNVNEFAGHDVTTAYPHVAKLHKTIHEHPHIAAYLAKRKVTPW